MRSSTRRRSPPCAGSRAWPGPPWSGPASPSYRSGAGAGRSPVPFLLVVSMVAVGGIVGLLLFNTSMQQASFAATSLQHQADTLLARQQTPADGARPPARPAGDRAQGPADGHGAARAARRCSTCGPGGSSATPTPATRLDPLRLLAPPPAKPAELDPPAHVVVVPPTRQRTTHGDSSGQHGPRLTRAGPARR